VHCLEKPIYITFLFLCLHLHLSLHVYLYTCNDFGLHNFRNSNSLLPYIALQPSYVSAPYIYAYKSLKRELWRVSSHLEFNNKKENLHQHLLRWGLAQHYTKMPLVIQGIKKDDFFCNCLIHNHFFGKHFSYCYDHSLRVAQGLQFFPNLN
jgi:hypothetical protein